MRRVVRLPSGWHGFSAFAVGVLRDIKKKATYGDADGALGSLQQLGSAFSYRQSGYIVMAYIAMAYIAMAYIVMTYVVMAHIVMAYIVMAYVAMAYVVMALYSYGPI